MLHERTLSGGCLCGQVRFEVRGRPQNVRVCHCRLCQKATASPFFARALYPAAQVTVAGELARAPSSAELERLFCPACGTRVGAERRTADGAILALALSLFDDQTALAPDCHFFTASKAPWLRLGDGLPQYEGWAPG